MILEPSEITSQVKLDEIIVKMDKEISNVIIDYFQQQVPELSRKQVIEFINAFIEFEFSSEYVDNRYYINVHPKWKKRTIERRWVFE